uniref:Membrane insertase YidC/Oxa/ALB C-terminal domain-containing protein n=1 Tax=Palpitomonas bilix TaxID=652834 RepID=A0A7S3CYA8_9EUKA|mmetsp:Transcript_13211/g.34633  ORF Transcript_13211/g.34633 Transcript_13211/m.34633 type:complete len:251 (+) Transcript_13211:61-813(+)
MIRSSRIFSPLSKGIFRQNRYAVAGTAGVLGSRFLSSVSCDSGDSAVANSAPAAVSDAMANASAAADTSSTPVDWLISGLQVMHDSTGMPWWGTIIGATVLVRAATLPVTVFQMQNVAKLAQIKPEMERLTDRMKDLVARGEHEVAQKYRAELKDLFKRNNASPMRSMASAFVQMPVFMSFFFALRRMAEEVPSFWEEGALWFENLSTSDPYYILPVISGGLMYINITLGSDVSTKNCWGLYSVTIHFLK